ncbi:MAG: VanZ family protein [Pseudomonadales bacterium]
MKNKLYAVAAIMVVVGLSFIATVSPSIFSFINAIPYGDKLGHFGIFGILTFVVTQNISASRAILWGTVLVTLVVIVEEFLQLLSATRTFSFLDLGASLMGVAVFAVLSYVYSVRRGS